MTGQQRGGAIVLSLLVAASSMTTALAAKNCPDPGTASSQYNTAYIAECSDAYDQTVNAATYSGFKCTYKPNPETDDAAAGYNNGCDAGRAQGREDYSSYQTRKQANAIPDLTPGAACPSSVSTSGKSNFFIRGCANGYYESRSGPYVNDCGMTASAPNADQQEYLNGCHAGTQVGSAEFLNHQAAAGNTGGTAGSTGGSAGGNTGGTAGSTGGNTGGTTGSTEDCPPGPSGEITLCNPLGAGSTIADVLKKILNEITLILSFIIPIIIIIGAFQMMFAAGNPEKFATGQKTIVYAIIGYVVVLLANGIISIVKSILTP